MLGDVRWVVGGCRGGDCGLLMERESVNCGVGRVLR